MNQPNACGHTPGPWEREKKDSDGRVLVTAKSAKCPAGTAVVAQCGSQYENNVANARLITSAPELLEACTIALACLTNAVNGCTWKDGKHLVAAEQAIEIIRETIAKATGEK